MSQKMMQSLSVTWICINLYHLTYFIVCSESYMLLTRCSDYPFTFWKSKPIQPSYVGLHLSIYADRQKTDSDRMHCTTAMWLLPVYAALITYSILYDTMDYFELSQFLYDSSRNWCSYKNTRVCKCLMMSKLKADDTRSSSPKVSL